MRMRRPLFEESGGAGGGGSTPKSPLGEGHDQKVIDRLTDVGEKVQMSRSEYDAQKAQIVELTAAAATATDLKTKVKELQEVADTVKKLYDPNQQDEGEARGAYVSLLTTAGFTKDDAEKEADAAFPKGNGDPNAVPTDQDPNKTAPTSPEHLVLKQVIDQNINDAVTQELEKGDLKKVLDFVAGAETKEEKGKPKVDGRESKRYKGMVEHLSSQTEAALRGRLVALRDRLGVTAMQTNVLQWIREESGKAGDDIAGKARLYVGDPNNLGRTPAGPPGESPFDVLSTDPVATPSFKENIEPGEKTLDQGVSEYMTDRLTRAAKEAGTASQV